MHHVLVRLPLTVAALGIVAALAAGCGSSAESAPANAKTLRFKLTDAGCEPAKATIAAGPVVFDVSNAGTSKVSEFEVLDGTDIIGEKEDLAEGLSGSFWITLRKGSYTLYCPGGSHERGTLTVTG
jgi:iron uptake system component EfeO